MITYHYVFTAETAKNAELSLLYALYVLPTDLLTNFAVKFLALTQINPKIKKIGNHRIYSMIGPL